MVTIKLITVNNFFNKVILMCSERYVFMYIAMIFYLQKATRFIYG